MYPITPLSYWSKPNVSIKINNVKILSIVQLYVRGIDRREQLMRMRIELKEGVYW